jgi:CheY-like chemotaxis protein
MVNCYDGVREQSTVTSSQIPSTSTSRPVVAVFNASQDTVDMLIAFFEQYGYEAVGEPWPAREPLDVDTVRAFVARHQPDVIVFDISFPYDHNWQRCREFHDAHDIQKIPVVLTTTNARALSEIVGPTAAIEIVGKPYDLELLAGAVARALPAGIK